VKREDLEDRLIHVLLCEHLGGEAPPDLVPRVLAAMPRREWARRLRALAAVVALAVVAVGAAVWWAGSRYPGPALAGDYALVGSEGLGRGAEVEAGARGARLSLGGYCAVTLAPGSRVVVGGAPKDEKIALKRGEVTCEVARGRGRFRVVTDLGTVSVAGTRFLVRLEEGGGQMNGRRLYVKVLAGTVLLATAAASETLGAGEERTVVPKGEGRIVATFLETGRDAARFWVKVQKVLAGDPALKGRTLVFVARPVKDGERWMPDPEQTALFRRFRRGDVLEIAYVTDEHYRVRSARLLERAGGDAPGLIEAGKGEYVRREGEKWREQGRIIGRLRNAPEAEMDALNATGAVVRSLRIRKGARNYELQWLKPGRYTLRVAAKGYRTLIRKGLAVRAGHDLVLPIEFSRAKTEGAGGISGFFGRVVGTVQKTAERGLVLRVDRVERVWKANRAGRPRALEGRTVEVVVDAKYCGAKRAENFLRTLRELQEGDRVAVELKHLGGERFAVVETLRKRTGED